MTDQNEDVPKFTRVTLQARLLIDSESIVEGIVFIPVGGEPMNLTDLLKQLEDETAELHNVEVHI